MSSPRIRRGLVASVILASLTLLPIGNASAASMICGERGSSYRLLSKADGVLTITVSENDGVSWQAVGSKTSVKINYGKGYAKASAPGNYNVSKKQKTFKIKVAGKSGQIAVSCAAGTGNVTLGLALGIGANSQTLATNTGVGINAKGRLGLGSNILSQNMIYVSTSNMPANLRADRFLPTDWSAWGSIDARSYSGGITGTSADFVGGVDKLVSADLLVGMLAAYGRTIISDTGTPEVASSPMLGLYFGKNIDNRLIIHGFLSYARPQNEISGASFTSSRLSAGLTVTGQIERSGMLFEPFLYARGFQEQQPSYTTGIGAVIGANQAVSFAASVGVKVNFVGPESDQKIVPYASAAADYRRSSATLGPDDVVIAPRIALGLQGDLGAGKISVDLDFGKTRSDTYDRGLKIGYEIKF